MDFREALEKYKPLRLEDLRDTGPAEALEWLERRINEMPRKITLRAPEFPTLAHSRVVAKIMTDLAREMDARAEARMSAVEAWHNEGGR